MTTHASDHFHSCNKQREDAEGKEKDMKEEDPEKGFPRGRYKAPAGEISQVLWRYLHGHKRSVLHLRAFKNAFIASVANDGMTDIEQELHCAPFWHMMHPRQSQSSCNESSGRIIVRSSPNRAANSSALYHHLQGKLPADAQYGVQPQLPSHTQCPHQDCIMLQA